MAELLAFIGVAAVVILTPGQVTALAIRNTLAGGRSAGVRTAAGVVCGQAVWAPAASAGAVARAGDVLRRPRVRRALDAVTGTLLIALGLRLAATQR